MDSASQELVSLKEKVNSLFLPEKLKEGIILGAVFSFISFLYAMFMVLFLWKGVC